MSHYPTQPQSIIANYTMLDKYGRRMYNILGYFYFLFAFRLLYFGGAFKKTLERLNTAYFFPANGREVHVT